MRASPLLSRPAQSAVTPADAAFDAGALLAALAHRLSEEELKKRLKERGVKYSSLRTHRKLVEALLESLEQESPEEEAAEEDLEPEDEGEPEPEEADAAEEAALEELRKAPIVKRGELVEGRAFFCWDTADKNGYFSLVCKEDVKKSARRIRVMCLKPSVPGVYVVDPEYDGNTGDEWRDHALTNLIFDARPVNGEAWREILPPTRPRSWHVVRE